MTEMGLSAPGALRLNVECWAECQRYGDELRRLCDPRREVELDERLKGVYGRMHVQAFKLAALFAALDWLKTSDDAPTVTVEHWHAAQAICEGWRTSAHRLLEQLDKSGEAVIERRLQDRVLDDHSGSRRSGDCHARPVPQAQSVRKAGTAVGTGLDSRRIDRGTAHRPSGSLHRNRCM